MSCNIELYDKKAVDNFFKQIKKDKEKVFIEKLKETFDIDFNNLIIDKDKNDFYHLTNIAKGIYYFSLYFKKEKTICIKRINDLINDDKQTKETKKQLEFLYFYLNECIEVKNV